MKKLIALLILSCTVLCLAAGVFAADAHSLSDSDRKRAEELIASAQAHAPEVSNEAVRAAHEDESVTMWFDHSYVKTPAETVTSNGRNTYQVSLAKNETECFWLLLAPQNDVTVTVKVSDFTNGGTSLAPRLYYGYYFEDVEGQTVLDPIPPLDGPLELRGGKSQAVLIKVKTGKETPAGQYSAVVSVYDNDNNEIKKANVYAYVWDFALPDASAVKTLADLGWWAIYAADPELYSGDDGKAYQFYYDTLLENKVNAYSMPYIMDGDYGSLEGEELETVRAYLDDPAVQAFNPLGWKTALSAEGIQAAYNFLSEKPEWLEKAYFYPDGNDEPMTLAQLNSVISNANLIKSVWGEKYKLIIPMHWNTQLDKKTRADHFEYLRDYVTVWCPHTFFFNTYADKKANDALTYRCVKTTENKFGTFPERMAKEQAEGDEVWWYVTRFPHTPEIALSIDDPEVDHRILFWQQKLYNVDGFLYYAVNDWYGAGSSQHNWGWDKKYEKDSAPINPFTFYGNGVLLYHGGFVGRLHECVESVRLESIRDGIEDYDYFNLIDEKYGEGTSTLLIKQITTSLGEYSSDAELFNKIRLAAGDLIAPDIKNEPEETETDKAAETEKETDKETEKAAETGSGKPDKGGFMSLWYLPLIVMGVAVAAVIIVRVIIMRNILKK